MSANYTYMFRRVFHAFGIAVFWLVTPIFAQTQLTYTVNNGAVTITGATGLFVSPPPPLIIPDTINGLPVTDIAGMAFYQNNDISSVVIGNNVTNVGSEAFLECGLLQSAVIGNSVKRIGESTFDGCIALTNVAMGSNLTWIDEWAFSGCDGLRFVTIPAGVTNISEEAFGSCPFLRGIYFKGNMPALGSNAVQTVMYYLPGASGWPPTYNGLPTILWNPQIQAGGTNFGLGTNGFKFDVSGLSNMWFSVEACTDLASANWLPIQTNRFTNVVFHFNDPQAANYGARFYRLQMP